MTNRIDEIRAMVKRHGGMFHGPRVEHLSMPETSFFAMMKEIDEAQSGLLAEVDRLRAALEIIAVDDVPRAVATHYRNDLAQSKYDKCKHDVPMWQDCGNCVSEFARRALEDRHD